MIDFELSEAAQNLKTMVHGAAEAFMRPVSQRFDEEEHAIPWDFINFMWQTTQGTDTNLAAKKPSKEGAPALERNLQLAVSIEELSWGDAGNSGAESPLSLPFPRRKAEMGRDGHHRARLWFGLLRDSDDGRA
jgi:hypothetical protein